jgi:hypothetical protein
MPRGSGLIVALLVGAYLAGAWIAYGSSLLSQRRYLATLYRSASLGETRRVVIDDEGLHLSGERSSFTWRWAEVTGLNVTQGLVLIWQRSTHGALAIPERCIEPAMLRDQLLKFIRARATTNSTAGAKA